MTCLSAIRTGFFTGWMVHSHSFLCLKIYWSRESLQKITAAQCFSRAPCNNPLVNCWLLSRMRSTTHYDYKTLQKLRKNHQKSQCPWSLWGVFFLFISQFFVEKFSFGLHFQVTEGIELHHRGLRKKWHPGDSKVTKSSPSILDGDSYKIRVYPGPIVLKELSDFFSDSRLFRVYRGWFCPQLYRDCTWPILWGCFLVIQPPRPGFIPEWSLEVY